MRRTSPTPEERSSPTFTILSASSVSSRNGRSPATATVSTGDWSLSVFAMIGTLASRGRLRMARATFSRTSCAATSMLRRSSNSTMTMDWLGPEIDRSSRMPCTVLTNCSISRETWVSTSSAEAPGSSVRMTTVGTSTAGKRSTPRRAHEAAPTTTSESTSMAAKTGRLMQTSASFCTA